MKWSIRKTYSNGRDGKKNLQQMRREFYHWYPGKQTRQYHPKKSIIKNPKIYSPIEKLATAIFRVNS